MFGSPLEAGAISDQVAAADFEADIFTLEGGEIGLVFPADLATQAVAGHRHALRRGVAEIFAAVAGAFDRDGDFAGADEV
jgi:hypothetical protein